MARTDQQFPLRLPPELKEKLENACKESGRSKNAEAVYRLEQTFSINTHSDVEKIPTEVLMMELASRMQGYSLTVEEITANKKAP